MSSKINIKTLNTKAELSLLMQLIKLKKRKQNLGL